jgi:hypothetical protein
MMAGVGGMVLLTQKSDSPSSTSPSPEAAAAPIEPGGDAASAALAQSNPDEFAWQLFKFINLEAAAGQAGVPAAGATIKQYNDDRPVVWETWALASGEGSTQTGSEVYKPDGSDPGKWSALPRGTPAVKVFSVDLKLASMKAEKAGVGGLHTMSKTVAGHVTPQIFIGPGNPAGNDEVRMNQAAFEFVQSNELYNIEGLAAKYRTALASGNRDLIQFPPASKEVKAIWVPTTAGTSISADEKQRYHWRKVGNKFYKLAGFHITSKDLKEWFWADFAQEDYETTPPPALPSKDTTTRGPNAPAKGSNDGERRELAGSKWAHYRLRGTQITFLDAAGQPIVVGNTLIESGVADRSSCMTCHFNATMGPMTPSGVLKKLSGGNFVPGEPNRGALGTGSDIRFLQNDFVWSAPFRAQHKVPK